MTTTQANQNTTPSRARKVFLAACGALLMGVMGASAMGGRDQAKASSVTPEVLTPAMAVAHESAQQPELLVATPVQPASPVVAVNHSLPAAPAPHAPAIALPAAPVATPVVRHTRVLMMEVTAYCPCTKCCGPAAAGITASGKRVSYNNGRFVAADTTVLPFGTKLVIPGYNDGQPVEVIDRGGAIKGNKLDLFYATHEEALEWGRQFIPVVIED